MKTYFIIFMNLIIFAGLAFAVLAGQEDREEDLHKGWIHTEGEAGHLLIQGMFQNQSGKPIKIRYQLEISKSGVSGKSSSKQSGKEIIAPLEEVVLATTTMNAGKADSYKIELEIFDADSLIARDTFLYSGANRGEE